MTWQPALTKPKELYVVEHVGRDPVLFLWLARARAHRVKVVYASGRLELVRWWSKWFQPGDFEEVVSEFYQTGEAHLRLYDHIEREAGTIERSCVFRRLARFFSHPHMSRTVRRWLMKDGFNQWILSLEVDRRLARGEVVKFFPARKRLFINDHCVAAWDVVPPSYHAWLTAKQWIGRLLFPVRLAVHLVMRDLWYRGLSLRRQNVREWKVAQKIEPRLQTTQVPDHELIYADGDLHPSRILHIVDGGDVTPEIRAYFQTLGGTVVYTGRLRMSARYFMKRVVLDFLLRLVFPCKVIALFSRIEQELLMAAVDIGWQVVNFEVFTQHHRPRVYFSWDAYSYAFNVRTMVWEQMGTRCVGYIHGNLPMPQLFYHGLYAHILLVPGKRMCDMFGRTLEAVGRVIPVGYMRTEMVLGRAQTSERSDHLVVAFDSSFSPIWGLSKAVLHEFYCGLLVLVEAYPSLTLYLKRKYTCSEQPNPAYAEVEESFEQHPRIKVSYENDAYSLLAKADSVVAITVSTTGVEALACHKPTVFFDPRPNYADNPYRRYHPFLVCHTAEELVERYAHILADDYPTEVIDVVVGCESKFCEERPLSYVRQLLFVEAGLSVDERH